jgi:putative PIN family toxin of toxin-antitoxin system
VVIDTNCMIRAVAGKSPYSEALERLKNKCHMIAYSKKIMKEYIAKLRVVGMSAYIFQRKLEDIKEMNKLKRATNTILLRARRKIRQRHLPLPSDRTDIKFLVAALAKSAKYIITTDRHLLVLNPYGHGNSQIKIVCPQNYLP